jgi:hypothetical protein
LGIDVAASIARSCRLHLTRGELREKSRLHDGQDTLSRSDMAILSSTSDAHTSPICAMKRANGRAGRRPKPSPICCAVVMPLQPYCSGI